LLTSTFRVVVTCSAVGAEIESLSSTCNLTVKKINFTASDSHILAIEKSGKPNRKPNTV